jgi:hypothetical protein
MVYMKQVSNLMKRLLILCVLLLTLTSCSLTTNCSDDPACTRVLFIGNSYTYVNDLPGIFTSLAKSGGHRVETAMSARGGWMLSDHVSSTETLNQIKSSAWDYVVLQEQSQVPASESVRIAQMYPAARTLVGKIREVGAAPILFITWTHRDGWPENGMPSYDSMQTAINGGYVTIGEELNVRMAPVGYAWLETRRQSPQLDLWREDGSHPNEQGTYLAACVFYAVVYRESPEGLSYTGGLSREDAAVLQKMAADTVLDHTAYWNIP